MSDATEQVELKKKRDAVAQALGQPFMLDFTEVVLKMRTHLLVGSSIGLAAVFMNLRIKTDSAVFGLQFEGLTDTKVMVALLLVNMYLFVHFFWGSIDAFQEWRLRLTGAKVAFLTSARFGDESVDGPSDPRQSTLYNWWLESARNMHPVRDALARIDEKHRIVMEGVRGNLDLAQDPTLVSFQMSNQEILTSLSKVASSLEKSSVLLNNDRIPVSLERFDHAFKLFLKSQNMRWLLLEWLTPVLIGFSANGSLIWRLYAPPSFTV